MTTPTIDNSLSCVKSESQPQNFEKSELWVLSNAPFQNQGGTLPILPYSSGSDSGPVVDGGSKITSLCKKILLLVVH